jgi:hypothetical protein
MKFSEKGLIQVLTTMSIYIYIYIYMYIYIYISVHVSQIFVLLHSDKSQTYTFIVLSELYVLTASCVSVVRLVIINKRSVHSHKILQLQITYIPDSFSDTPVFSNV